MSNKLSNYAIYNNWEKLDENSSLINEKNFSSLVEKAVKYHSKECFDILIQHQNAREWLSKYPIKLTYVFQNFVNAPNNQNEYYLNKVLPFIAVLNNRSIEKIMENLQLFSKIFTKLKKDEKTIKHMFVQVISRNNIETFKYIYNWIKSNPQNFPFFNNNWVSSNILFACLEQDNLEILKELEKDVQNLSTVNIGLTQVPSLIISLLNKNMNWRYGNKIRYYFGQNEKKFECFKYLLNKGITTEQNLIWSAVLEVDDSSWWVDYFHLNIDWSFDFSKYQNDDINLIHQVHDVINSENLLVKLTEYTELDDFWLWKQVLDIIQYLIKTVPIVSKIKNYLSNINTIQDVDIIEKLCVVLLKLVKDIESPLYRRTIWKRKQKKIKGDYLLCTLEIIRYFKENKLTNFNLLNIIEDYTQIKNKTTLRQIVIYLMKLGYVASDDFKNNIVPKIFTKKEVKDLDKIVEKSKLDEILKTIKMNVSNTKQYKRKSRKSQVLVVPGIDGENEKLAEQLELNLTDDEDEDEDEEIIHESYDSIDSNSDINSEHEPYEIDV
jgi:hypothetical protein